MAKAHKATGKKLKTLKGKNKTSVGKHEAGSVRGGMKASSTRDFLKVSYK
jgi:hypothetical protein